MRVKRAIVGEKQAAKKPANTALICHSQEHDLADKAGDAVDDGENVTRYYDEVETTGLVLFVFMGRKPNRVAPRRASAFSSNLVKRPTSSLLPSDCFPGGLSCRA